MSQYPIYSDNLVALARAFDRASLAVHVMTWHLHYLEDQADTNWESTCLQLLRAQLPAMKAVINSMIVAESQPLIDVIVEDDGMIPLPRQVQDLLGDSVETAFDYLLGRTHKDEAEVVASIADESPRNL